MKYISKLIILLAFVVSSNAWGSDYTYLMRAAHQGNLMVVQWLLKAGADVNQYRLVGYKGETALTYAISSNHIEVVQVLLNAGADVNHNYYGTSALRAAVGFNNIEAVQVLLNAGADVNIKNRSGGTVLMLAAQAGLIDIFNLLIKNGATLHDQGTYGGTAFTLALRFGHLNIIQAITAIDPNNSPTVAGITSINRVSNNLIKINWDVNKNKNNVKSFKLEYRERNWDNPYTSWISHNVASGARNFYLYGLDPKKSYRVRIKVKTDKGWSDYHETKI